MANSKIQSFKAGNYVVYPTHGVGKIVEIKEDVVMDRKLKLIIMSFDKEQMKLIVPYKKAEIVGLRHLTDKNKLDEIFTILQGGTKKQKGMWSRRAQEYENKVNSGNIKLIAEVLRDLTRDISEADRSYSERLIYESALERLVTEYSIIKNISYDEAREEVISKAKNKMISLGGPDIDDDFDDDFDDDEEEDDIEEDNEEEEEEEE